MADVSTNGVATPPTAWPGLSRAMQYLTTLAAGARGGPVAVPLVSLYGILSDLATAQMLLGCAAQQTAAPVMPGAGTTQTALSALEAAVQKKIDQAMAGAQAKLDSAPALPTPLTPEQQADVDLLAKIVANPELKAKVQALVAGV